MKKSLCIYMPLGLLLLVSSCQEATQRADLIITNANIWTGNEQQISAQSMAIVDDSIIAIGTNEEIQKFKYKATEVVDANGSFITPGFIDSHVHLIGGGNSLLGVDLKGVNSPEEFKKRIATYAKELQPGAWILEGNWDNSLWGGELPQKEWIDEYTRDNPVFIYRYDGHSLLANSLALEIAGIDKNTPDVPGGEIVRNRDGIPTGILKDNAQNLVWDKIPPLTETQQLNAFKAAMTYLASYGVTSVHDMDGLNKTMNYESYSTAVKLNDSAELSIRVYAVRPLSDWNQHKNIGRKNDRWLKTSGLKGFVDGSLGSYTAALIEPYMDKPNEKGLFANSAEDLYQWISSADKEHLQLMIHAIGDSAIHTLLDIYERVIQENGVRDRRLRIEHVQHLTPKDIKRFAQLGVIASMQPYLIIDDGRWAEPLIGKERMKTMHAVKSLVDSGATLAFGSDWPVIPASPLEGIYAAVTRRTLDDKNPNGWVPEQKITVEQALIAYTKNAAYASFEEDIKGTLEPGKLADFVIISEDLTKVDPVRIKDLKVLATYVGGKKVFDANEN